MTVHAHTRWLTMRDARVILIALGILGLVVGAFAFADVRVSQYPAVAAWLIGALILHDAVIAGVVFATGLAFRRAESRVPHTVILLVQTVLVIAAIVSLVTIPLIFGQIRGPANPTVLPLDYSRNLALFLACLAVLLVVGITAHVALSRRVNRASSHG